MSGVLLTDEEMADILNSVEPCQSALLSLKIAKAQLKKVAKHISELPTDGHDKWYYYNQDLAKSLLKEVEE